MKQTFVLLGLAVLAWPHAASALPTPAYISIDNHWWEKIIYPDITLPFAEKQTASLEVNNEAEDGLRLTLTAYVPGPRSEDRKKARAPLSGGTAHEMTREAGPEDYLPDPVQFRAVLHYADKTVANGRRCGWLPGPGNAFWHMPAYLNFEFPWGRNALDEAWIELRVAGRSYWLELPYGFTRDMRESLCASDRNRGEPTLAVSMNDLADGDKIVPWLYVRYDLGIIQNGWRMGLYLSNPFDGKAELVLLVNPKSDIFGWDLHSPRTAVSVEDADGSKIQSMPVGIRSHEDMLRRSDSFALLTSCNEGRCWGTVQVKVDDKMYARVVPSSLYHCGHGTACLHHKARLPVPKEFRDKP
jgi:hypothetical protein